MEKLLPQFSHRILPSRPKVNFSFLHAGQDKISKKLNSRSFILLFFNTLFKNMLGPNSRKEKDTGKFRHKLPVVLCKNLKESILTPVFTCNTICIMEVAK